MDDLAGLWALLGSACGGTAALDPASAAAAVPLGILCGVFAYRFKRRKTSCDEVIDDPPRNDYTTSTRPQRDRFDPERLDDILSPVQVHLCKLLAKGDADLRAAVRADERAQGAYIAKNREYLNLQGVASDAFIDAFALAQMKTGNLVEEMSHELRVDPRGPAMSIATHAAGWVSPSSTRGLRAKQARDLPPSSDLPPTSELAESTQVSLAQTLPPEASMALRAAGISTTAFRLIEVPRRDQDPSESIVALNSALMSYAKSQPMRAERLHLARQSRPAPLERLEASEHRSRTKRRR